MKKNCSFKLNNSHNRLVIISLMFTILLFSSFAFLFVQADTTHTVTFNIGTASQTIERPLTRTYTIPDGKSFDDQDIVVANPQAASGSYFVGWQPRFSSSIPVTHALTYNADWITNYKSSGVDHDWGSVLSMANPFWTIPVNTRLLTFTGASTNGHGTLNYALLNLDVDTGHTTVYFLCNRVGNYNYESLAYLDISGTCIATYDVGSGGNVVHYTVWAVDITDVLNTISTGGALTGSFDYIIVPDNLGSPHNVHVNGLQFTNVRAYAYHYEYYPTEDPFSIVTPFAVTPIVGSVGDIVTVLPLSPVGCVFTPEISTVTGTIHSTGIDPPLNLYYEVIDENPLWELRGALTGLNEKHIMYDGLEHDLREFMENDTFFSFDVPNKEPGDEYVFLGTVTLQNPGGIDAGRYDQILTIEGSYSLLYTGLHADELKDVGYPIVAEGQYAGYVNVTVAMRRPAAVPTYFIIDPLPLAVITEGKSGPYIEGEVLTKNDVPPRIMALDYTRTFDALGIAALTPKMPDAINFFNDFTATDNPSKYEGALVTRQNGEKDTFGFTYTGAQTSIGKSFNTYDIEWAIPQDPDDTGAYYNSYTANPANYVIISNFEQLDTLLDELLNALECDALLGTLDVYGTVTYDSNFPVDAQSDGVAPTDDTHYYQNDPVTVLGKSTLEVYGYTFNGWKTIFDGTEALYTPTDTFDMPDKNVILYAHWTAISDIIVTFDANAPIDATIISNPYPVTISVTFNNAYGPLADVDVYGYTFNGWFTSADVNGDIVTSESIVTNADNHKLYAHWTAIDYTIVYAHGDHGSWDDATETYTDYHVGELLSKHPFDHDLNVDHDLGWTFNCWTDDNNNQYSTSELLLLTVKGDATYTATWTAMNDLLYTVEYRDSVSGAKLLADKTVSPVTFGETFSETAPSIAGYNVDADIKSITIKSETDNVLVFIYTPRTDISYVVNYYLIDTTNSLIASITRTDQTMASTVNENAETIAGYTPDADSKSLKLAATDNEINFYYTANIAPYEVHYYLWDGGATTNEVASHKYVDSFHVGSIVVEEAIPVYGFVVYGESSKTLTLTASDNIIVFYYTFREPIEIIYYTVEYDGNGATSGEAPIDRHSPYVSGSVVQLLGQNGLAMDGYIFLGWSTRDNANVAEYEVGATFNIFRSVKLFAVWELVPTYTVTYSPGLHGAFDEVVYSGLLFGVATPGFVGTPSGNPGYTFVSWSPTVANTVSGTVTYVAQWSQIGYAVTYNANGGSGAPVDNVVYHVGESVTVSEVVPARAGYTFNGWLYNGVTYRGVGSVSLFVMPASDVVLVAQWTVVPASDDTGNNNSSGSSGGGSSSSAAKPASVATAKPVPTLSPEPTAPPTAPPVPPEPEDVWALVNLILSVTGFVLVIVVALFVLLVQRKQKQQKQQSQQGAKSKKTLELKGRGIWLMIAFAMGIAGVVVFLLTENMDNIRVWFDGWTIVNVILFVVEIIAVVLLFSCGKIVGNKEDRKPSNNP